MKNLRNLLVSKILTEIPQVVLNGHSEKRLPNNAHFNFHGCKWGRSYYKIG